MDQVVVIDGDAMGVGERELGRKLLKSFLTLLCQRHEKPRAVVMYNLGIRLGCKGSEVVDLLRHLEQDGVEILLCGTCVDYYNLEDKVIVGTVSNMGTIQDRMMSGIMVKP
jgi:selenium metabolism protein YedF